MKSSLLKCPTPASKPHPFRWRGGAAARFLTGIALVGAGSLLLGHPASAQSLYWDTSATSGLQTGNGTWAVGTAGWADSTGTALTNWADSNNAIFETGAGTDNLTVSGTVAPTSIQVLNTDGSIGTGTGTTVSLTGGTVKLGTGGLAVSANSGFQTAASTTLQLNGSQTWNIGGNGGNSNIINGSVTDAGASTLTVTNTTGIGGKKIQFKGTVNVNALTIGGTGAGNFSVIFTAPVSTAGALTITSGFADTTTFSGATTVGSIVANANTLTLSGATTVNGPIAVSNGATVNIQSASTVNGTTTITNGGIVSATKDGAFGNSTVSVSGSSSKLTLSGGTTNSYVSPTASLFLSSVGAGNIALNFTGTDTLGSLSFDGGTTFAAPGTYGAVGSGALFTNADFTGSGLLTILAAAPEPSQWAALLIGALGLSGLMLKARRRQVA